jgi:GGDEF domain-containing protein
VSALDFSVVRLMADEVLAMMNCDAPDSDGPDVAPCPEAGALAEVDARIEEIRAARVGMQLAQGLDDPSLLCDALGALGECFKGIGDSKQSERLLSEALVQARRLNGGFQEFAALTALCAMAIDSFLRYRDMGRPQEASDTHQRALGCGREMWSAVQFVDPPNDVLMVVAQGDLGLVLRQLEAYQQQRTQDLERVASTDPLTGLGNRRLLETLLPGLIGQAGLQQHPMTLAMPDLMTSTRPELAHQICERLRLTVERHGWESVHPQLRVTLSLGMASAPPYDLATLTERADAALYRAKREGRNRVCVARD